MRKRIITYQKFIIATMIFMGLAVICNACYKETAVPVKASFSTVFVNSDESVPVQLAIGNQSTGADTFEWTFEGAEPSSATDENPGTIVYTTAGTYSIKLKVSNVDGSEDVMEQSITVVDGITIDFSTTVIESDFPPVEIMLTNNTSGEGLTYEWIFEGGIPANAVTQHPPNVIFESPGEHLITLKVTNGFETFSDNKTITVVADIAVSFDWEVDFFDDDYQAPVTITLINNSSSATAYNWTFQGGTPLNSSEVSPKVTFNSPGTYTISLEGTNGKHTAEEIKEITVVSNTNLKVFTDVSLGINSAHHNNSKGAFFSTTLREVFSENQVSDANGEAIDIMFLGLNSSFGVNKFVSPDEAEINGFTSITNASHTKFINSQELCACGVNFTTTQFDAMVDDADFQGLTITETAGGLQDFDNNLPRVVLFETANGRKGAIKIKGFVNDGSSSYIICDIKVQKLPN